MANNNNRRWAASLILLVLIGACGAAGAQPLTKQNFRDYLDALENVDAEALKTRFYHRDFAIQLGDQTLDVDGLLAYETALKELVDFRFEVEQIVADDTGIAIDTIETFTVRKDADVPNIGPARAGDRWRLHLNVFYTLTGGKISSIKANVLSAERIE